MLWFGNRGPAPGPPPSPGGRVRRSGARREGVSGVLRPSPISRGDRRSLPDRVLPKRRVKGPLRRPRRLDAVPRSAAPLRCARPEGPAAVPASRSPLTRRRRPSHSPRLPFPDAGPPPLDRQRRSLNHPRHRHLDTRHRSLHGSVGFTITFSLDNGPPVFARLAGAEPWEVRGRPRPHSGLGTGVVRHGDPRPRHAMRETANVASASSASRYGLGGSASSSSIADPASSSAHAFV